MAFRILYHPKGSSFDPSLYRKRAQKMLQRLALFWEKRPALLSGISFALGGAFLKTLSFSFLASFLLLFFFLVFLNKPRFFLAVFCFCLALFHFKAPSFIPPSNKVEGLLQIQKTTTSPSSFGQKKRYEAFFSFTHDETTIKIPVVFSLTKPPFLFSDKEYALEGFLHKRGDTFFLKPIFSSIVPVRKVYSLDAFRGILKKKISQFLSKNFPEKDISDFLYALFTSEITSSYLRFTFSRLGLSHLLAISGFHFSVLSAFLFFFLSRFLSNRKSLCITFSITTCYFLFLGPLPSVFRTWLLLLFYFIAEIFRKKTDFLNLLGASLFFELLFFPSYLSHLGFLLSFLCCLALYVGFPAVDKLWGSFFSPRKETLSFFQKGIYSLGLFYRKAFSIQIAIFLMTSPLLFYTFHKVPLFSFLYNLWVPLFMTLILPLLFITILFSFLNSLLFPLILLLRFLSYVLLRCILHPPAAYEYFLYSKSFTPTLVLLSGILVSFLFLFLQKERFFKDSVSIMKLW